MSVGGMGGDNDERALEGLARDYYEQAVLLRRDFRRLAYALVEKDLRACKAHLVQDWHGDIDGPSLDWDARVDVSLLESVDFLLGLLPSI